MTTRPIAKLTQNQYKLIYIVKKQSQWQNSLVCGSPNRITLSIRASYGRKFTFEWRHDFWVRSRAQFSLISCMHSRSSINDADSLSFYQFTCEKKRYFNHAFKVGTSFHQRLHWRTTKSYNHYYKYLLLFIIIIIGTYYYS